MSITAVEIIIARSAPCQCNIFIIVANTRIAMPITSTISGILKKESADISEEDLYNKHNSHHQNKQKLLLSGMYLLIAID